MGETEAERVDELRERLLDAAVRVFAAKGYDGTKIMDIVREAELSTGAVYGRFSSKDELLREAVTRRARGRGAPTPVQGRVADLIALGATITEGELTDDDAVRLEAHVAARRVPEVADAIAEAGAQWRVSLQPIVDRAMADGSVAPDVDPSAVLYFVSTMRMGLLAQRAAGVPGPDPESWRHLIDLVINSFGSDRRPTEGPTP